MKLSVSMDEADLAFLDDYAERHNIGSRSGALRLAVRALRALDLQDAYQEAFDEWDASEDAKLWDRVAGDGLNDGSER